MPTTAVTDLLRQLIQGILSDPAKAEAYSQNPAEYLAAHGVNDHDLAEVDIRSLVVESAAECSLPEPVQQRIDDYGKGEAAAPAPAPAPAPPPPPDAMAPAAPKAAPEAAPAVPPPPAEPPAGASPAEIIEHHISYATYVTYESNTNIVQNLVDNSTYIDNSSNVSVDVDGNVYGDIDLTNEVSNATAMGDGAMAVGGDMVDSNANTGSGDINDVGTINAQDSAVAVGGNATNTQDRSYTDNSTDNSTNISDSYNDNSTNTDNSTNVNVQDSFNRDNSTNTDNSTNIDVDVRDSFNDNSDNSTDNSTNIDVALGGGRSGDDPGFGRGSDTDRDGTPDGKELRDTGHVDEPYTRDGTQEQIDEKYGDQGGQQAAPMQEVVEPIVPQATGLTREAPSEMAADEMDMMD